MRAYERKNRDPRNEAINRLLLIASAKPRHSWVYPTILAVWSLINLFITLS